MWNGCKLVANRLPTLLSPLYCNHSCMQYRYNAGTGELPVHDRQYQLDCRYLWLIHCCTKVTVAWVHGLLVAMATGQGTFHRYGTCFESCCPSSSCQSCHLNSLPKEERQNPTLDNRSVSLITEVVTCDVTCIPLHEPSLGTCVCVCVCVEGGGL